MKAAGIFCGVIGGVWHCPASSGLLLLPGDSALGKGGNLQVQLEYRTWDWGLGFGLHIEALSEGMMA